MRIVLLENRGNDRLAVIGKKGILIPRGAEINKIGGVKRGIFYIIQDGIEKKYCSKCKQFISVHFFSSDKYSSDGKNEYCGFCNAKTCRERRKKQKKIMRCIRDGIIIPPGAEIFEPLSILSYPLIKQDGIEKKYCSKCKQFLPLCNFYKNKKGVPVSMCKECAHKAHKMYKILRREKQHKEEIL